MSAPVSITIAVLLLILNGFFVAAEFALVKVRSTRIDELSSTGISAALIVQRILSHLDAYLSACQLGITLTSIALGMVGEGTVAGLIEPLFLRMHLPHNLLHPVSFVVSYSVVSMLHIVVGEQAPKTWAIQQPERLALAVALPLHVFYMTFRPAIYVVNVLSILTLKLMRIGPVNEHSALHSEEELRLILAASGAGGVLRASEVDLVQQVFQFGDRVAGDIRIPRVDIVYLDVTWPLERNRAVLAAHSYTRYPLCEGGPDHVLGMIHVKDMVAIPSEGDLRRVMRTMHFVPETQPLDRLLREFQRSHHQMAIVLDEFGGTAGLVTLEDVVEQIVGEIHDEHEEEHPNLIPIAGGRWQVDGGVHLDDLREDQHVDLPTDDADTVGGWVLETLGAVPERGAVVDGPRHRVTVLEMDGQRVRWVLIEPLPVPLQS